MRKVVVDVNRAIELYDKYGSINRAALSVGCSPIHLKKIFIENNVQIKQPKAVRFNIKKRIINASNPKLKSKGG